ncbi:MAG: DHHW family protein [Flavobacteriales bacterium]
MKKLPPLLLLTLLLITSVVLVVREKESISETEKRTLAIWPSWSVDAYFTGSYFDSISGYINDHFPLRNSFVDLAQKIRYNLGFHLPEEERIVVIAAPEQTAVESSEMDTMQRLYDDDFQAAYSGSMLIIDGRVYPQGGGSPTMGRPFASMVNEYAANLNGLCTVYSCVAPLSSAFIPVEKYARYNDANKNTLYAIKEALTPPARFCDVFGAMDRHFGEQMFYGTDHHWNARGAYYAYTAFCDAAGLKAVPLEAMRYERKRPFLGSLYDLTKDPVVAQHPDTLELFIPNIETQAVRYGPVGFNQSSATRVFGSANNYMAFLSGDAPLIKITTNVKNGRKAAVVKNSMGNAFAVYLISNYEGVWVVDVRYSGHSLMDLIAERQINDLIFGMGLYGAMSHGTIRMMRNLAKVHEPALSRARSQAAAKDSLKKEIGRPDSSLISTPANDSIRNEK